MTASIRVLIVEDHPEDAELMARLLTEDGFKFKWQRVETEPDYLEALETRPDLILADWTLPKFSAPRALKLMQERDLDIPFIIVSGTIGEESAVAAMHEGAYDYVLKDRPARLGQAVRRALEQKKLRHKRRRAEETLRESGERFRLITENMGDMVWLIDMDLKTVYVSPSVVRVRGFTLEELQAMPVEENFTPASWQTTLKALVEELTPERVAQKNLRIERTLDLEYYRKDGSTFWSETTMVLVRDKGGKPTGIIGVGRDITDRKLAEEALRESQEKYRIITENMSGSVWLMDMDFKITFISPSVVRARGFTVEEVMAMPLEKKYTQESLQVFLKAMSEQFTPERLAQKDLRIECNMDLEYYRKDGSTMWSAVTVTLIRDKQGNPVEFVGTGRDITERKRAEEELRESQKKFQALVETTSDFIWEMDSHGVYTYCSPQMESLWGLNPKEMLGKTPFDLMPVEDREQAIKRFSDLSESRTIIPNIETRSFDGAGQIRFIEISGVPFSDTDGKPIGYRGITRDITERKRAEEALERSERMLRAVVEGARDGILATDAETKRFVVVNDAICRMLGYNREEMQGLSVLDIHPPESMPRIAEFLEKQLKGDVSLSPDIPVKRKDGSIFYADVNATPIELGGRSCLIGIFRDITERKRAEEEREKLQAQFVQAQKMESVGRLAGGVAHDFNNMLQTIIGRCELAFEETAAGSPIREDLLEIQKAANRSADLTRQLLAFARKQTVAPQVLDLNDTVEGMLKMLRRLIGEDIDLFWKPGLELWPVKMDPSQIDQILANLSVNARDAISGTGKVTIETENVTLDEAYCAVHVGFFPGHYVQLAISDDGCGMDPKTLEQIFEPFFTTKKEGEGTGLGLATVFGIVKQNEGFINVYSEPGKGTTFKIYLSRFEGKAAAILAEPDAEAQRGRGEAVLLVEDEESILNMGKKMLERLGYVVLTAGTPAEALRQVEEHGGEIHLLITDVVMPEMNGRELAERIVSIQPNLKCLFMSGYTANAIAHRGVLNEGVRFVQKPFSLQGLAAKVREALDG